MTPFQIQKIANFIRENMMNAVFFSDDDDLYAKSEYKTIEIMLRMMASAKLMHPSTYIYLINVLKVSYNNARKMRKEQENE